MVEFRVVGSRFRGWRWRWRWLKVEQCDTTTNMIRFPRGKTTDLAKRGQILAYTTLTGSRRMKLVEIAANAQVPVSTCSDIINKARRKVLETGNSDLCAAENLAPEPNSTKGCNAVLTAAKKQRLIDLTLSDAEHCRMIFGELVAAGNHTIINLSLLES